MPQAMLRCMAGLRLQLHSQQAHSVMDLLNDADRLQTVADYRAARKNLKASATGCLVFGVVALIIGVLGIQVSLLNAVLIPIGLAVIVVGGWNLAAPSAEGFLVDGAALMLVGLWNLFLAALPLLAGRNPGGRAVFLGALAAVQIGFSVYRFVSYPRFARVFQERPSPEELAAVDRLVQETLMAEHKTDADVFELQARGLLWQGKFFEHTALFLSPVATVRAMRRPGAILFAHKDDVNFRTTGKALLGSRLKATFRIKDREMQGTISPESLAKYERWKQAADGPEDRELPEP